MEFKSVPLLLVTVAVLCAATALPGTGASTAVPWTGASTAVPWTGASTAVPGTGASTASPGTGASTASPGTGAATAAPGTGADSIAPGTGAATAAPGTGAATASPGTGAATASPGTGAATAAPGTGADSIAPGTGAATAAPGTGAATAAPGTGAATAAPGTGAATAAPGTGAATAAPGTGAATAAPGTGAATAAPGTGAATAAPGTGAATAAPGTGAATAAPGTGAATAAPGTGAATAAPGTGAATAAPGTGAATAAPGTGAATAAPGTGAATAAPGTGAATAAPGTGAATAAPGTGAATAAPGTGAATAAPGTGAATAAPGTGAATATAVPGTDAITTEEKPLTTKAPITEKPDIIDVEPEVPVIIDVAQIPTEVIVIVAVDSSIQFEDFPFVDDLKNSSSQAYTDFADEFINQVEPFYNETEGFESITVTSFEEKPSNKRRAVGDVTIVNYEVNYDYKKLQNVIDVINTTALEQAIDGGLTVNGKDAVTGTFVQHTTQDDIYREAAQILQQQIDGDLCEYTKTCQPGYTCVSTSGTCISKCNATTGDYCSNDGRCVHTPGRDVFCTCNHDPTGFYVGEKCEFYASQALVIGLGAGVGGLLLIIIITLSVCLCCRRNKKGGDFERQLTPDNAYWTHEEKAPMTKQTDDMQDEMPLYSMVNKRQTYSEDSYGSEKNNVARASRLSSQDRGSYATPTRDRERSTNDSFLHGNLRTFGGHDNRAYDWAPSLENVPVDQKFKLPRARVSTSNNQW
ncbi:translation initiation factor IF-2-like [Branchiostoma floridae]|uniref:Translation initiation factor IF-2-like n=1 Tax=Branchiostoma floridae TaxID=7739 RepID=A0A9J7HNV3_BRAFL|nr:translation initiation factor IF-2-like [Branchiostoma floridae]